MGSPVLSVIIPSKPTERFLRQTAEDVLAKANSKPEVIIALDGAVPTDLPWYADLRDKVTFCYLPPSTSNQKRQVVNLAASIAHGEYLMCLDAHCMVAEGFDEVLIRDHQPNWVQVPRRHRLDAENWSLQDQHGKPPIDYEYPAWSGILNHSFDEVKWDARTLERMDIPIDDDMSMQASCWFMTKAHFVERGFMQTDGYGGWGQECEELCWGTWLTGGRVVVNKKTYFAHLRKGRRFGRMYRLNDAEVKTCFAHSFDFWINNRPLKGRVHNFEWLIEKFMPLPGWPEDWEGVLYGNA